MVIYCTQIPSGSLRSKNPPKIILKSCEKPKSCKTKQEIDKLLESTKIWVFALADSTDFSEPTDKLKTNFKASSFMVSNLFKKSSNFMLRDASIELRSGMFIQKTINHFTFVFHNNKVDLTSIKPSIEFLELEFSIDKVYQIFIVKELMSFFGVLTTFGGLYKGITLLLLFMVVPVREILFNRKMINETFNVCIDKKQVVSAIEMMTDLKSLSGTTFKDPKKKSKEIKAHFQKGAKKLKKIIKSRGKASLVGLIEEMDMLA